MKTMLDRILLGLILLCVICLQACGDDNDKPKIELEKLPPATQEGKGTFGCLVDGKAWVIKSFTDAPTFYQEGVFQITAQAATSKIDQYISIVIYEEALTTTNYFLIEYGDRYATLNDLPTNCEYVTSEEHQGELIITHFDQINFIISGTFEFEAYSDDCSNLVKVTKGRFDLQYAP